MCFFTYKAALDKKRPYSPFQNTNNMAEYAVARLDDLLNWGRKVTVVLLIGMCIPIITIYSGLLNSVISVNNLILYTHIYTYRDLYGP